MYLFPPQHPYYLKNFPEIENLQRISDWILQWKGEFEPEIASGVWFWGSSKKTATGLRTFFGHTPIQSMGTGTYIYRHEWLIFMV